MENLTLYKFIVVTLLILIGAVGLMYSMPCAGWIFLAGLLLFPSGYSEKLANKEELETKEEAK